MKCTFAEKKKHVVIAHAAIVLAVLLSSEPFNNVDVSPWILILGLCLLLIYYFLFRTFKLRYIPKFDIIAAFCNLVVWIVALFTCDYWTNITGWDRLIYILYPFVAGAFFLWLIILNLFVFAIQWIRAKRAEKRPIDNNL